MWHQRKRETETVPRRSAGGAVVLLRHEHQSSTVGAVCDVNSQIVMATAGTADSGSTAPTGIELINLPTLLS